MANKLTAPDCAPKRTMVFDNKLGTFLLPSELEDRIKPGYKAKVKANPIKAKVKK